VVLPVGAALVLGPLAVLAFLVVPDLDGSDPPPSTSGQTDRPTVSERARALLDRAATAPAITPYHGLAFVAAWTQRGSTSEVVSVDHVPGRGTSVRSAGTAAAPARRLTVQTSGAPSLGEGAVGVLAHHYSLSVTGEDRVAGRPVDVVTASRPGAPAHPEIARFWLDRSSGLVLRREVYDEHGRTVRASAFVEVDVGSGEVPAAVADRAWTNTLDQGQLVALRRQHWHCPAALAGALTLVDARRNGTGRDAIVHLAYTDGIASVSVFEQRGRLDDRGLAGHRRATVGGHTVWVRGEVPQRLVWSSGRTVYTVVADAPTRTVDAVVAALPHRNGAGPGTLGRLGRGLDRVASWFNPFG
jgi:sigma-E factor negative regulatory protein RseB